MGASKRVWLLLVCLAAMGLAGCPRTITCPAGEILENNQCYGDCRVRAPPCWSPERMMVVREDGGVGDGATDASADADAIDVVSDVASCATGQTLCAGRCVDVSSDIAHCGRCGTTCPAAAGERALCAMSVCSAECLPGYERVGMACEVKVPRLIGPMSTSYVSSQRPTLRWEAPMGVDGAAIEVCAARDCAMVVQRGTVTGGATSWRVQTALSAGVYWWRVKGRAGMGEGTRASAVWEFVVGARDRATDTNWGTFSDVNGDGYGDLVVGDPGGSATTGSVQVFRGSAAGPVLPSAWGVTGAMGELFGSSVGSAGDVNGDGYGDVIVGAERGRNAMMVTTGSATIVLGGETGLTSMRVQIYGSAENEEFGAAVSAAGDVDGDGYGDVIVGAPGATVSSVARVGRVYVFRGGPMGITPTPSRVLEGAGRNGEFGRSLAGAIDGEADRFGDIVIGAPLANDDSEGEARVGYVRYYRGGMAGISAAPTREWMRLEVMGVPQDGARWGASVSGAGDVNGDGYGDFVFGGADPNIKRSAFWVPGGPSGVAMVPTRIVTPGAMDANVSIAGGGADLGADGFDDVFVRVDGFTSGAERVLYRFNGTSLGPVPMPTEQLTWARFQPLHHVVFSDINRDDRADLIVSNTIREPCAGPCRSGTAVAVSGGAGLDITGAGYVLR